MTGLAGVAMVADERDVPDGVGEHHRIYSFLDENPALHTPFLIVDLDIVRHRYRELRAALPQAGVYFAVKANPDPAVVGLLASLGSHFDVASIGEIELCLELGIEPSRLSYGNTVKKNRDVRVAYEYGVRIFAVDSHAELAKVSQHVHDGTVLVRLASDGSGADWPLSRKFGCTATEAISLLRTAADQGLAVGVSFHVGSQQRDPRAWQAPLATVAHLAESLDNAGHRLSAVNLGGGLPSKHFLPTPPIGVYGQEIERAIGLHLGTQPGLAVMIEPGRFLVGDAGLIRSEVVLVTHKASDGDRRWVYLDVGIFNGLTETQEEAIRYRLRCPNADGASLPSVLAGPTCDSLDIIYERELYPLPTNLDVGDHVDVLSAGAYTASYSSVCFNGFEPLRSYHLPPTFEGVEQ